MNIITSKYSARELNEIYEKEMEKIDKKARARAEGFDITFITGSFFVFMFLWLCIFLLPAMLYSPLKDKELVALGFFFGANIITLVVCVLLSKKAQSFLYKHYRKQGKILESPFEGHWHNIRFVEKGEKLQTLLSSKPEMEVLYYEYGSFGEKNFIPCEKDSSTGMFIGAEVVQIGGSLVKDEDWDKFMLPDGTLDFSIYDKVIEEVLSQIEEVE